ncbi:hypothetical protein [Peribacillus sp. TH27]|uniref:hypothetical protein n=1 Tax=Peribacillus sp. TH27 TaxID=2798484 RepID=UPI0019126525|nr:hypothetical protein [Peribacillus sp. TH27]MBK5461265.1 hypothetical protein [Peribacillus sp. TH27]
MKDSESRLIMLRHKWELPAAPFLLTEQSTGSGKESYRITFRKSLPLSLLTKNAKEEDIME